MIVGSLVGGLIDAHLHIYPHITSPINHQSFPYLADFMTVVSGVGAIKVWCPVFCDIHLEPKISVIYNSISYSSNLQGSRCLRCAYLILSDHPSSHNEFNQSSFLFILSQFYDRRFLGWRYRTLMPYVPWYTSWTQKFCDLKFDPKLLELTRFTLPMMSLSNFIWPPHLSILIQFFTSSCHRFTALWIPGFTKVSKNLFLLSIPATFAPSQCTLIMILLVTTHHTSSKRLSLIREKIKDIFH